MKNPEARLLAGPKSPDGMVAAGSPEGGLSNKYAPGDPGITGQTDVNWASVAPIRFARQSIAATKHLFGHFSD